MQFKYSAACGADDTLCQIPVTSVTNSPYQNIKDRLDSAISTFSVDFKCYDFNAQGWDEPCVVEAAKAWASTGLRRLWLAELGEFFWEGHTRSRARLAGLAVLAGKQATPVTLEGMVAYVLSLIKCDERGYVRWRLGVCPVTNARCAERSCGRRNPTTWIATRTTRPLSRFQRRSASRPSRPSRRKRYGSELGDALGLLPRSGPSSFVVRRSITGLRCHCTVQVGLEQLCRHGHGDRHRGRLGGVGGHCVDCGHASPQRPQRFYWHRAGRQGGVRACWLGR